MYGTSGKGSPSHLEVELLRQRYGIEIQDVPYKSFGQAITDTMNGLIGFYFPTLPAALPHITSGKVRSLAVGSPERSPQAPQLPTIAEQLGLPGYEVSVWYGIVVPAGTPAGPAPFGETIRTETAKGSKLVKELGLQGTN